VLGTLEVRAMDGQSALWSVAGLAALVHALAHRAATEPIPARGWIAREVLMESSFRAARDGLDATVWWEEGMRPVREVALATLELARPHARELGSDGALDEVERLLAEGNGAIRQRAVFARGGLPAVLAALAQETRRR
jgi:carboxylate-amine ligase